ncbi:3'-5' exonuclease [Citrobacter braakii]|uniref:3'-5' exonuclease n=1 Tax=Citrobacter braakii TaxID=57706 RepID=UPI0028BEDACC|nr:3'-5' exonuclease [Citrobacter braakii]MDT7062680.1 3'-5' exonuclease [Citrobacter braakii]
MMPSDTIYLDTEGTGLNPDTDAMLEIAIVDDAGRVLLDSLIAPPPGIDTWPQAQAIHGISPAMVAGAPSLASLAPHIEAAVLGRDVVIYNAAFDTGFLGTLLDSARSVTCCMEAWSEHVNEWDTRFARPRWQNLASAAAAVGFIWPGNAHRALADTLACRAVWQYLHNPAERERVDLIIRQQNITREANRALATAEREKQQQFERHSQSVSAFLAVWWERRNPSRHWATGLPVRQANEEFANIFFGMSLKLIRLEDQTDRVYKRRSDIPADLKAANWFCKEVWFQAELQPVAAYVGKKTGWLLYSKSENDRLRAKYPLRFASVCRDNEFVVLPRSGLKKCGLTDTIINQLTPVAERRNQHTGDWYYVYRYARAELPNQEKAMFAVGHCWQNDTDTIPQ